MGTAGRPTECTQEIRDRICEELVVGKSLRSICSADDMPDRMTVLKWVWRAASVDEGDPRHGFDIQYAQAREQQAEAVYDDLAEIADDGTNDWVERERKDGNVEVVLDHEHVQRSKLRIDTRKWILERMRPKRYGANAGKDDSVQTMEVRVIELPAPGTPAATGPVDKAAASE